MACMECQKCGNFSNLSECPICGSPTVWDESNDERGNGDEEASKEEEKT